MIIIIINNYYHIGVNIDRSLTESFYLTGRMWNGITLGI